MDKLWPGNTHLDVCKTDMVGVADTARKQITTLTERLAAKDLECKRCRMEGAAALADLLIRKEWVQRVQLEGIDSPGLLSEALDELAKE